MESLEQILLLETLLVHTETMIIDNTGEFCFPFGEDFVDYFTGLNDRINFIEDLIALELLPALWTYENVLKIKLKS